MGLPKGNGADNARDYLKGAIAGGGLWHALEVLDDAVLQSSVSTLNDVTLTSPNIGPSEWTDSQHTHASAATAGSTLGPGTTLSTPALQTPAVSGVMTFGGDATLQRTGVGALRLDTHLGVAVAPAAWGTGYVTVQLGQSAALVGSPASAIAILSDNSRFDGANNVSLVGGLNAVKLVLQNGGARVETAPAVALGAVQTFTTRASLATTGTLFLTPDAATAALTLSNAWSVIPQPSGLETWKVGAGAPYTRLGTTGTLTLTSDAGADALVVGERLASSAANFVVNARNGAYFFQTGGTHRVIIDTSANIYAATDNAGSCGISGNRWTAVYAVSGVVNSSSADLKTDITPLDPAAALAAVLATDPVTFTYTAPAPTAEQYELPDDPEQAEQVLYQRLVNGPLLEAARSQAGFVLEDATGTYQTDPLFETGKGQSNAANSVGIALAAIHELNRRLTAGGL